MLSVSNNEINDGFDVSKKDSSKVSNCIRLVNMKLRNEFIC